MAKDEWRMKKKDCNETETETKKPLLIRHS